MKNQTNEEGREEIHQMKTQVEEKGERMEIEIIEYQNRVIGEENYSLIGRVAKDKMTQNTRYGSIENTETF